MKHSRLILALAAFVVVQTAHAGLLEIRGGYGVNSASPDAFENRVNTVSNSSLDADNFDNYNVDIFFDLPVLPLGVGLRHEWIKQDQSSNGSEWDLDAKNISVLVDWRLLDTLVYVGPIVGIGYPSAEVDFDSGSTHVSDKIKSGQPSYSVGAEAGVKLGKFLIGAEVGYSSLKFEKISNNNVNTEVDLSGVYGKAMVGLTFF